MYETDISKAVFTMCVLGLPITAKGMNMDSTDDYTPPDISGAGGKTLHWLACVVFLLLIPSATTVFELTKRSRSALALQLVTMVYSILDAVVFRFPDGNGVENSVSRHISWFLSGLHVLNFCLVLVFSPARPGSQRELFVGGLLLAQTIAGWFKCCVAPVALFGFCRNFHTGQCLAHGIMGTAFVLYGFVYLLVLVVPRFSESDYSQDYIDSWVMCIWGIFNTFTEHRWGREPWNHGDYQHTAMGIVWACGGFVGILLGRNRKRTFVPGLLIIFTGWAMSQHAQHLVISTKIHYLFGLILMVGGACRIVEISFLLKDSNVTDEIQSFQYLAPFCLTCAGILFMAANEEQLILVLRLGADHSSYGLIIISASFVVYLWMLLCLDLFNSLNNANDREFSKDYDSVEFELNNVPDFEPVDHI